VAFLLLLTVGLPLAMPFGDLVRHTGGWRPWEEAERLRLLVGNTLRLVAGTLAVALPVGIVGAVLLYRTDLPGRSVLRFLTVLTLFVPLPLLCTAWQAALGSGGWLPVTFWSSPPPDSPDVSPEGIILTPWPRGMAAAIWIHALAALPWVILLVGQGLCWVERELEEDASTVAGPWGVLWTVTRRRCAASIWAAALWVALLAATEITVTDLTQVRTFAEEVYTQYVAGGRDAQARAVAVSLPLVVLTWACVLWAAGRWERTLPPLESVLRPPRLIPLGWARWPCLAVVLAAVGLLIGVPLASLVWKAGQAGSPESWSTANLWRQLSVALTIHGRLVVESLALAVAAGAAAAGLGLVICWLAVGCRWFHAGALVLMAAVWALPGPVIYGGLDETIQQLLNGVDMVRGLAPGTAGKSDLANPIARALWYGPSPIPILWVYLLRFFPLAVAVLWPIVRLLPEELRDAARVDGARPGQELRFVVLPLTAPACVRAGLAVTVLSLGELSASKLLTTPGSQTFAHQVFAQMHYSATNNVAALCLVLLAAVVIGAAAWAGVGWLVRHRASIDGLESRL
jgi:iron(III) transport system permease protein